MAETTNPLAPVADVITGKPVSEAEVFCGHADGTEWKTITKYARE